MERQQGGRAGGKEGEEALHGASCLWRVAGDKVLRRGWVSVRLAGKGIEGGLGRIRVASRGAVLGGPAAVAWVDCSPCPPTSPLAGPLPRRSRTGCIRKTILDVASRSAPRGSWSRMSERHREELLDFRDLRDGTMAGLSSEVGGSLAQAGAVCLASQHHEPGVELVVTGRSTGRHPLDWESPDDQAHRTWRNEIDATENGARGGRHSDGPSFARLRSDQPVATRYWLRLLAWTGHRQRPDSGRSPARGVRYSQRDFR